jgi:hypothetical protein
MNAGRKNWLPAAAKQMEHARRKLLCMPLMRQQA